MRQSIDQLTAQLDQTGDRRERAQIQAEIDWLKPYADYQWNMNYDVAGAKTRITELDKQIASKQREYQLLVSCGADLDMLTETHETLETLEAERARLYQESYFAELIQTNARYRALMVLPDFAEYSRAGANLRNGQYDGLWDSLSGINTSYYELANPAKAMREEKTGNDTSYLYMTEEEYGIYNYLLAKEGKASAEQYHKSILEILNAREGQQMGENVRGIDNDLLRVLATGGYGLVAGLDQFGSGIAQNFTQDRLPTSSIQYGSGYIRNDLGNTGPKIVGDNSFGQLLYDTTTTAGNMAPSVLLSSLLGGLGMAAAGAQAFGSGIMGLSARGNAYNQARAQGYSPEQAGNYATMIGVSEATLQYILGGVGKLGGKLTEKTLAATVTNIDNALWRVASEFGLRELGELSEEYLQAILEPGYRNLILGENNEIRLVSEDAVYSLILALFSTGVLEGPDLTANFLTQRGYNSILNPYFEAYYNYLNSTLPDTQNPSPSLMAPVSEDELIGRYFDEAWDTEDFVSPL